MSCSWCLAPPAYTLMTPISSLTLMTGTCKRAGDALGGAVTGARLAGGHRGVGHEVHVGPGDARAVGAEDDRAVHLGELGQALRTVRRVEQESAAADGQHVGTVADDDQRTHLGPDDAVEPVAQRRAWCNGGEGGVQRVGGRAEVVMAGV